jgi:hypothetical protein
VPGVWRGGAVGAGQKPKRAVCGDDGPGLAAEGAGPSTRGPEIKRAQHQAGSGLGAGGRQAQLDLVTGWAGLGGGGRGARRPWARNKAGAGHKYKKRE